MKLFALTMAVLATNVAAFARMDALTGPLAAHAHAHAQWGKRQINAAAPQGAGALPLVPPLFDAKTQYVSNKGAHAVR